MKPEYLGGEKRRENIKIPTVNHCPTNNGSLTHVYNCDWFWLSTDPRLHIYGLFGGSNDMQTVQKDHKRVRWNLNCWPFCCKASALAAISPCDSVGHDLFCVCLIHVDR